MNCIICGAANCACGTPTETRGVDEAIEVSGRSTGPRVRVNDGGVIYGMRLSRARTFVDRHPESFIVGGMPDAPEEEQDETP